MLSTKKWEAESLMSCETELQGIATALRRGSPYFKEGWNINALQAFIRDGGCCAYCGKPLLNTWDAAKTATIDHLLPSCRYPERGWNVDNLVPACAECNHTKHNYDPSEQNGKELVITEEVRVLLIRKAKDEIDRKTRANDYWEREFQTARMRFQDAVTQYRQYGEPPATA
jgi:hypothetical protein